MSHVKQTKTSAPVAAGPSLAGVHCARCGAVIVAGSLVVDEHVYKLGELVYISILHAACDLADVVDPYGRLEMGARS